MGAGIVCRDTSRSDDDSVEALRVTVATRGAKILSGRKALLFDCEEERGFSGRA